jgi:hypothetical protein
MSCLTEKFNLWTEIAATAGTEREHGNVCHASVLKYFAMNASCLLIADSLSIEWNTGQVTISSRAA